MRKFQIILVLFLALTNAVLLAVPAKRMVQTVQQPDGSILQTVLQGDEKFHYLSTIDGIMLEKGIDNSLRYAVTTSTGVIAAGEFLAHDPEKRESSELEYIQSINSQTIANRVSQMRAQALYSAPWMAANTTFPNTGTVKGLIILAQFQDVRFSSATIQEDVQRKMNEKGYSDNSASGSARDYFIDQSSGKFTPTFDVAGPVTLPHDMAFYGANTSGSGSDKDAAQMVVDACKAADTEVDFSNYDFDNDGKVDLVFIIYAGYAEAQGGVTTTILPHAWDINNGGKTLRQDGKVIAKYACTSELMGYIGSIPDGIGTFCHEFSHCLGLPDFYDT